MMYTWEWNIVEWPNLGFVTLVETALLVPLWEYLILALLLASIWLYYILDFHFVDDLLHGFRGEVPRLHFSSASYLTSEVLATCKILKQRYSVVLVLFVVAVSTLVYPARRVNVAESQSMFVSFGGFWFVLLAAILVIKP